MTFLKQFLTRRYLLTAVKYAVSVGPSALVNWGLLYLFTRYTGIWYLFSEVLAAAISSIPFYYTLLKVRLVSINKSSDRIIKPSKLLMVNVVGLFLNWGILYVLTSGLGVFYVLSEVLATLLVFAGWSFNMNVQLKVVDLPARAV